MASAKQLAARARFTAMVKAKAAARKGGISPKPAMTPDKHTLDHDGMMAIAKGVPVAMVIGPKGDPKTYKGKSLAPGGGGQFAKAVDAMTAKGLRGAGSGLCSPVCGRE